MVTRILRAAGRILVPCFLAFTSGAACALPGRSAPASPRRCSTTSAPSCEGWRPRKIRLSTFDRSHVAPTWTRPNLVVQIGFAEWTRDGRLRQPRFLGLRDDKRPADVIREEPQ